MRKSIIALSVAAACASTAAGAATLLPGDNLSIDAGSNFVMGGGSYGPPVPVLGENGLTVGLAPGDTGTGSHGGFPTGADTGAVTQPWGFFCNTGYDYLNPANGSGSFSGDTTSGVDMTAWTVTWNAIPNIPMGGCSLGDPANNGGFSACDNNKDGTDDYVDSGIGAFSWSGTYGDTYTITYTAHVPSGDPSGFGGVQYDLTLTGVVTSAIPVPAAVWLFGSGLLGLVGVARRRKAA